MSLAESASVRHRVYALLITVAVAAVCGRILAVERVYEPRIHRPPEADASYPRPRWPATRPTPQPTLGGNDRSRWATIRALVDHGTYIVGHRDIDPATGQYQDRGILEEDGWGTYDKVLHPETYDFYSSKPPLLPTLLAGEYWLLKNLFGWTLTDDRFRVVRVILLTVNALPLIFYLLLLSRMLELLGATDWGRFYTLAAAAFGTLLTTFAIALNNHSIATYCAVFALYPALRIWCELPQAANDAQTSSDPEQAYRPFRRPVTALHFALAGFFAAFTACNELPAASFAVALMLLLLWRSPRRTLLFAVPAAAVPVAAFLFTNWLAIGDLVPAYSKFGGPWYEYEGSHWKVDPNKVPAGIDYAGFRETKAEYAFHVLIGHHGLFSLTPIYLLAVLGMVTSILRRSGVPRGDPAVGAWPLSPGRMLAVLTLLLSVVVIGFYIVKTDNYGGWTSGLRWLIWLAPLWLLTMSPVVDWLGERRWGRGLAYVLLAVSVMSASYPAWNPWRHPWLYNLLETGGWISY